MKENILWYRCDFFMNTEENESEEDAKNRLESILNGLGIDFVCVNSGLEEEE